ncbi:hypothetical protein D9756_008419 [Leucocoprinus leucothites]|uniref:phosphatidylinositol-3,4,5-trisphosphate 3-phosphatase n=1 Tax=Leucocoprinus leucothites TaxID=201217 RepID=A0A8H5FW68_9AGAR|nr:hypothetical protein D9756_008419 [Leucoagaricus leucothites]
MTDYIRRLVSGKKARFKDDELSLELDLVYVTDRVIIMGYPATGLEGYYRNRREDVKKFLDHRHGENYWIYNFCPLGENSYDPSEFEGRVSRYPFPDHHAPPLAIMPLVAREVRAWLDGSQERVAVLHCKAGKGRSGTMTCTYLLSLDEKPTPPKLKRSHTAKEWAKRRAEETMEKLPKEQELDTIQTRASPLLRVSSSLPSESDTSNILDPGETGGPPHVTSPGSMSPTHVNSERSFTDSLKGVLDLHTARRMKAPTDPMKKQKQGVSIPSQRRFLHYWALCLAYEAPRGFWNLTPSPSQFPPLGFPATESPKQVRLTEIKLRLRELSTVKLGLIKAANIIIDKAKGNSSSTSPYQPEPLERSSSATSSYQEAQATAFSHNHVWVSLARYDDEFVETLEEWERYTRDESGKLGVRRPGSDHRAIGEEGGEEHLADIFESGQWDKHKMVRCFARLGEVGEAARVVSQGIDKEEKIRTYTLRSLSHARWKGIKDDIQAKSHGQSDQVKTEAYDLPADETRALSDTESRPITPTTTGSDISKIAPTHPEQGVILDPEREVRIKLYMGKVFMGWIWLIPTFHMPQSSSPQDESGAATSTKTTIRLTRKEIDFPVGLGAGIIDAEISMEWVVPPAVHQESVTSMTEEAQRSEATGSPVVFNDQYAN